MAQNLVPNGSFESFRSCPIGWADLDEAFPWEQATLGTPDIYNRCVSSTGNCARLKCVPCNAAGCQEPRTGDGYAGFAAYLYEGTWNEYMQVELTDSLEKDEVYLVTFYMSLSDKSFHTYATSKMGMYLGTEPVPDEIGLRLLKEYTPQVTPNVPISSKVEWTKVQQCYTAEGGERFVVIGCFDTLGRFPVSGGQFIEWTDPPTFVHSYFFVDDVSIIHLKSDIEEEAFLCPGDSVVISVTTDSASYLWQDGSTADSIIVTDAGVYSVDIQSICVNKTHEVVVNYTPIVGAEQINQICLGDSALLTVDTAYRVSYQWSTNETSAAIFVKQQDTFLLTSINSCGDTLLDTFPTLLHPPIPDLDLSDDSILCPGRTLRLGDSLAYALGYQWQDSTTQPYLDVTEEGLYSVTITTECWEESFEKNIYEIIPKAFPDSVFCIKLEESFTFKGNDSLATYNWPDGTSDSIFTISSSGIYEVTVEHPCSTFKDTISVTDCSCRPFIPNSFTPNGDELNDVFKPILNCVVTDYELFIYDRFGKLLFSAQNQQEAWDGTFKENVVNAGVYVYYLTVMFDEPNSEPVRVKGNVTLIR